MVMQFRDRVGAVLLVVAVVASGLAPVGPSFATDAAGPWPDFVLDPDTGLPWVTGAYENGVDESWSFWPACGDLDGLRRVNEDGNAVAAETTDETETRDDFCIEAVTLTEAGDDGPVPLVPVIMERRAGESPRFEWMTAGELGKVTQPDPETPHARRIGVQFQLQQWSEEDTPRLTMVVTGGSGCTASGDDMNPAPFDIGDCIEVKTDDGPVLSQFPCPADEPDEEPANYSERKANLTAKLAVDDGGDGDEVEHAEDGEDLGGWGENCNDARNVHTNLVRTNLYGVVVRIGNGTQLDPFAATFTGTDTGFSVSVDEGVARLAAFGKADARPGRPPQDGTERLERAFDQKFRDSAAGRDLKPWAGDAQDYYAQTITFGEGDEQWEVGWDSCDWERRRASQDPPVQKSRSQFLEIGVLNATFFLAEAFTGDLAHLPEQLRGLVVETDANNYETTFYSRSGREISGQEFGGTRLPLPTWNPLTGELSLRLCNPHFAPLYVKTLANVTAFTSRGGGAASHDGERESLWPSTVRPVDADGNIVIDDTWKDAAPTVATGTTTGSARAAALDGLGIVDFVNTGYYRVRLTAPMLRAMGTTAGQLANSARVTIDGGSIHEDDLSFAKTGNELFISASGFSYSAPEIAVSRELPAIWPLTSSVRAGQPLTFVYASDDTIAPADLTLTLGEESIPLSESNSCALADDRLLIQVHPSLEESDQPYTAQLLLKDQPPASGTFRVTDNEEDETLSLDLPCTPQTDAGPLPNIGGGGSGPTPPDETVPEPGGTRRVEEEVDAGGTVELGADEPTAEEPISVGITTPQGGTVAIGERPAAGSSAGFTLLGSTFDIVAPNSTPGEPLRLVFTLDASLLPGTRPLAVLRNGVVVPACKSTDGTASPDPCLQERRAVAGGDLRLTVLSSSASTWAIGAFDPAGLGAICAEVKPSGFEDVPVDATHAGPISCLTDLEIVRGLTITHFDRGGTLTRAQAASLVARLLTAAGVELPTQAVAFEDVPVGSTHATSIGRLAELGIVRGDGEGRFNPADPVTRGQLATMAANAMEIVTGRTLPMGDPPFTDVPTGSTHAVAITKLHGLELVNGTSATTYQPSASITREQAAAIVARLLNRIAVDQALA